MTKSINQQCAADDYQDFINFYFLQTQWRKFQAVTAYKQQKKATLTLQCLWRARVARKELRKLRMVISLYFHACSWKAAILYN